MDKGKTNFNSRLAAIMFKFDLAILMLILLPFILLLEKCIPRPTRNRLWRHVGCWIVRNVLQINNISIHRKHADQLVVPPAIYAANHPSAMDGFLLFSLIGSNTILFVAPLAQFPQPLRFWLKKMEAVDVRRDPIDDKRYPSGHSKEQAIKKAIQHLHQGKNLIIFPEGHIEILHVLHYFHTGPSRIALAGHAPTIPVAIVNADKVFPDEQHLCPGEIFVSFGQPLTPPLINNSIPPTSSVIKLRQQLEQGIAEQLPLRYLPNYYQQRHRHVGLFIDIDRTLYEGLSQKDLIGYLLGLHKIHARQAFKIFYWLFLEKLQQIRHEELMKRALLVLRGWDVTELNHVVHRAFEKKLMAKIQYGIFPLIKDHLEEHHPVVLVSEVIHPLAREFKKFLTARATLDTKLKTVHHCYTGEVRCLCYKNEKARLVADFAKRAGIDLNKSYAFADSSSDLPFLQLVKYPVAVNPDEQLLHYAVNHDWPVILNAS